MVYMVLWGLGALSGALELPALPDGMGTDREDFQQVPPPWL